MVESMRHESFYKPARGLTNRWACMSVGLSGKIRRGRNALAQRVGGEVSVFFGDEFPEPGTARRLGERGHALNPEDYSYLVHLRKRIPPSRGLNGQFHGLLVNRKSGTVTLFNDRYGLHRIYYHEAKEASIFAAEAKAILEVCPELRSPIGRGWENLFPAVAF